MAFPIFYRAWDPTANDNKGGYVTGDKANHTILVDIGLEEDAITVPVADIEGRGNDYRGELSDEQLPPGTPFNVRGTSDTPNVTIIGGPGFRPYEPNQGTVGQRFLIEFEITQGLSPLPSALITITTSSVSGSEALFSGYTNFSGKVEFPLKEGTYYLWRNKPNYAFDDPIEFSIDASGNLTVAP